MVHLDEGYKIKRHIDQLRPSDVPKKNTVGKSVQFGPVTRNWYPLPNEAPATDPQQTTQPQVIQGPVQELQVPAVGEAQQPEGNQQSPRKSRRLRRPPAYLKDFVPK